LQTVSDARRVRLEETLRAWLMHMGNRTSVAEELHVHPQTVRYRLAQLRELLGSAIDDPGERAALVLAVAWGSGGGAPEQRVPAGGGGVRRAAV
jgi:DNA-binding PucR family transcriptional regulator